MDEGDRKIESQCWKTIFITITLLAIGAVIGHLATVRYYRMPSRCGGGYSAKACWGKGGMGPGCCMGHKCCMASKCEWGKKACDKQRGWAACKKDTGKCKPGCACPKCSKKKACLSEQIKAGCPLKDKEAAGCKKDIGKCKPGCTCPKCVKKADSMSEPDKTGCPLTDKEGEEPKKEII